MEIKKATWQTDEQNVRLSMPLTKVDKEKRIVSGFASLDNADTQGDIVLKEANQKAFARFRGNIREMHQPIAVGRMLDFREDSFYDDATQKFYNGIWVNVYVSKGAEDTWEKVLDGTLQGFSIGGNIIDAETQFVKDAGRSVRFVKDYELFELSLVDSPANPLANVFSIEKSANGPIFKGMIADAQTESVFWCKEDKIAKTSTDESMDCNACGRSMTNIGWYEFEGSDDRTTKMAGVIAKFKDSSSANVAEKVIGTTEVSATTTEQVHDPATNEGGVDVAEETKTVEAEPVNEVVEAPLSEENVTEVTEVEEPVVTEEAADVSEVEDEDGPDFEKMFGDIQTAISQNGEATTEAISKVKDDVEKVRAEIEKQVGELAAKHDELSKRLDGLNTDIAGVEKRIDGVISGTAVQKSSRGGSGEEKTITKSRWQGSFFGSANDL